MKQPDPTQPIDRYLLDLEDERTELLAEIERLTTDLTQLPSDVAQTALKWKQERDELLAEVEKWEGRARHRAAEFRRLAHKNEDNESIARELLAALKTTRLLEHPSTHVTPFKNCSCNLCTLIRRATEQLGETT